MRTSQKKRSTSRALPQDISEKLLQPITEEEADIILSDPELQAESKRTGIALEGMVARMRMTVTERFELLRQKVQALYEREETEEEYRIHAWI